MIAVWGIDNDRFIIASGFLLMAFLLKYYAIFLVLIYWKRLKYRGLTVFFSGLAVYGIFVILVPQALLGGILTYAESWYFNASIFWIVVQLLPNFELAKYVVGGLFILILGIFTRKANKEASPPHSIALLIIGVFLLLQPNFHPWHIFWIFPFVLLDNNLNFSWILLSGTLIFSYHVYIAYDTIQVWMESVFIRLFEYIPFYAWFTLEHRQTISKYYRFAVKQKPQ